MPKKTSADKSKAKRSTNKDHERGLWKGSISFGLVNIAVRLVSSRERAELHFTMLDPSNLSPVGYKYYNKTSGHEVSRAKTVKAYEFKPKQYVILTEADFKRANVKATQSIEIENFVALDEIDPVFFERAYYLLPMKGAEKAYALLNQALLKSEKVAIAKFVLHTKQHLVAVIPRGKFLLLELLHFAEDVKDLSELADMKADIPQTKNLSQEVAMAERLIEDMTTKWKPETYEDTYRSDVMKLVKAKVKAGKATEIAEDFVDSHDEESSTVKDLLPLLRQSLGRKHKSSTARQLH